MIVEFKLTESELRQAVAEYVSNRYETQCDPKDAHFHFDGGGDGPLDRGNGYSARISGTIKPKLDF